MVDKIFAFSQIAETLIHKKNISPNIQSFVGHPTSTFVGYPSFVKISAAWLKGKCRNVKGLHQNPISRR